MSSRNAASVLLTASVYFVLYCNTRAKSDETALPKLVHPFHVGIIENATNTPIRLIDITGAFGLLRTDGASIAIINSHFSTDPGRRIHVKSHTPWAIGFCEWTASGDRLITVAGADLCILRWPELVAERKWLLPSDANFQSAPTVTCIEASPSGKLIAIGCVGKMFLIDTSNDAPRLLLKHDGYPTDIAFSPDESRIAYAGLMSPSLVVRDTQSGDLVYPSVIRDERPTLSAEEVQLASMAVYGVAFSSKGNVFAACGASNAHSIGELRLWNWIERRHLIAVKQRGAIFRQIVINDAVVYLGSCAEFFAKTGSILEIEIATGRHLSTFAGLRRPGFSMAIAREARVLAAASDIGELYLWKTNHE